ncbi:MAG: MraY family glycosyltransferase [Bacteroidia bacterium]
MRKSENIIRWSDIHKPALGGITFFITFLLSLIIFPLFFESSKILLHSETLGLLAACTVAFLMGLADDAYDTNPVLKFSGQVFCGIILIYSHIYIQLFQNIYFNYFITMLWVVGIMNAINLLDNMDAISSIASLNVLVTILCLLIIGRQSESVFFTLIIGTASAISAFLLFNWYPSKMYMGDTGTQFLGAFMAAVGVLFLWGTTPEPFLPATKRVISVLLSFALPIIDTTVVFTNRLLKGTSPFVGGKDHTTHHLFYLGFKEPRIAVIYSAYSGISLLCVVFINKYIQNWSMLYFSVFTAYFIISLIAFFVITRIKKKEHEG